MRRNDSATTPDAKRDAAFKEGVDKTALYLRTFSLRRKEIHVFQAMAVDGVRLSVSHGFRAGRRARHGGYPGPGRRRRRQDARHRGHPEGHRPMRRGRRRHGLLSPGQMALGHDLPPQRRDPAIGRRRHAAGQHRSEGLSPRETRLPVAHDRVPKGHAELDLCRAGREDRPSRQGPDQWPGSPLPVGQGRRRIAESALRDPHDRVQGRAGRGDHACGIRPPGWRVISPATT